MCRLARAAAVVAVTLCCGCRGGSAVDAGSDSGVPADDAARSPERIAGMTEAEYDEWLHGYCDHVCEEMDSLCAGNPWQLENKGRPFDFDACEAQCEERLTEEPALIANYHCHAPTCEEQWACIDADPLSVPGACGDFCEAIDRCGTASLLEFRGSREVCEYLCAGGVPHQGFDADARCIASSLGEACNVLDALDCIPFVEWQCQHVCGPIDGSHSHSHGEACEGPTGYEDLWPDVESCMADCAELSKAESVTAEACFEANRCGDVSSCWPLPPPDPACEEYCRDLLTACPGFDYPEPSLCAGWCNQAAARVDGWPECAEPPTACPDTASDLERCPAEPVDGCAELCEIVAPCIGSTDDACIEQCSELATDSPARLEEVQVCVEGASDCDEVRACVPE